jgi:3-methyladenine DNA glycosylase AlkD
MRKSAAEADVLAGKNITKKKILRMKRVMAKEAEAVLNIKGPDVQALQLAGAKLITKRKILRMKRVMAKEAKAVLNTKGPDVQALQLAGAKLITKRKILRMKRVMAKEAKAVLNTKGPDVQALQLAGAKLITKRKKTTILLKTGVIDQTDQAAKKRGAAAVKLSLRDAAANFIKKWVEKADKREEEDSLYNCIYLWNIPEVNAKIKC